MFTKCQSYKPVDFYKKDKKVLVKSSNDFLYKEMIQKHYV